MRKLVAAWYDHREPWHRTHAVELWSDGRLYEATRRHPSDVWSPMEVLSPAVDVGTADRCARNSGLSYRVDGDVAEGLRFVALYRSTDLQDTASRELRADDLDEAARIAVESCPGTLFVVAVLQADQLSEVSEILAEHAGHVGRPSESEAAAVRRELADDPTVDAGTYGRLVEEAAEADERRSWSAELPEPEPEEPPELIAAEREALAGSYVNEQPEPEPEEEAEEEELPELPDTPEVEAALDRIVQSRLRTDRRYLNAANAEEQAEAEAAIEREAIRAVARLRRTAGGR